MLPKYWFKLDLRGEAGVATTLVITSLLLVSGAAATTVIDTNNDYQQQAESTAIEAINEVATGLTVIDVIGHVESYSVNKLDLVVRLNPGSPDIDVSGLTVVFTSLTDSITYTFNATDPAYRFEAKQLNIASGTGVWKDNSSKIMGSGDLIKITITGFEIQHGRSAKVNIIPAFGQENFVKLNVPDALVGSFVTLR
ncbi:MAG: Flagellin B2 precursor [Methanomassiliicoccales archaeon PtaU1.Bin124]|nr:MAG: Flagellin B2 precursor [Methanomassiliicoccales archaeon PtaU1.Bin124]